MRYTSDAGELIVFQDRTITVTTLLKAVAVAGPGASVEMESVKKTFHVTITATASVAIEVSNDGVGFIALAPAVTATNILTSQDPWKYVRANVVSYTSGTITVLMGVGL